MKSSSMMKTAAFFCATGLALFSAGCAGTPTKDSTGEYVDDATITTKVKAALIADGAVKSFDIHVTTFKGIVQLSGFVENADQKTAAGHDAATIAGVKDVKNNITSKM